MSRALWLNRSPGRWVLDGACRRDPDYRACRRSIWSLVRCQPRLRQRQPAL